LGKAIEVFFLLPRQLDGDEDADMQPERFLVDGGDIARDHAALFHQLDAAMAGRNRQADLVGQLLHGAPAVGLQQAENLAVDGVEGVHWYELAGMGPEVVIYPNNPGYVAII